MDQDVDKTRSVTTSGKQRAVPKGRVQRFGKFARSPAAWQAICSRTAPRSWLPVSAPGEDLLLTPKMR